MKYLGRTMKDRFRIYLSLALLYAAFIFYLSSGSNTIDSKAVVNFLEPIFKSFESTGMEFLLYPFYIFLAYPNQAPHLVYYAGFGFVLYLTIKNSPYRNMRDHPFIFAMVIGTAYGISDEFHQFFVPGRHATLPDLLADIIGLAMAQAMIYINGKLPGKKTITSTLDLKLILILILLSIPFILIPPFNQTYLRIILALPLLLFLPGYLFITVLFPKKGELSPIERFTLSIGLSIAITVFDGFALNYTPWGFRPNSIVVSLSIIMLLLLGAAYLQRRRLGEQTYDFSIEHIRTFYHTLISKDPETGPEYDPALEKMLIRTMIIAILLVSAMLVYAKVTTEPEKFTALYILGENGRAENYPTDLRIGETSSLLIGVENHEHAPVNYTLRVNLGGLTLREQEIILDHNFKWLNKVTFVPQLTSSIAFAGTNKSKLEIQVLRNNISYRSVHLLVNISLDLLKFAALPNISNGDMESDNGWLFTSNSTNITGGYAKSNPLSSSGTYEINFAAEKPGSYGTFHQNLTTYGDARAILSFDVRDSDSTNTSNFVFEQALIDGLVVWETGAGGKNGSWSHVEIPVLLSGSNNLAFRVYNKYPVNHNATFWWDNVQLKPYGLLSRSTEADNKYEMDVKLSGFYSAKNLSLIKLSVENTGTNKKNFVLKPAPVMIDDLGNKYDMVNVGRGSQIAQTAIYPGAIRNGSIFFKPVNSSAKNISLILYLNGEKYEFSFKAEPGTIEEGKEADIGETIYNSGFEVGLYGYQNTQDWNSKVIIAVKNREYEEKPFKLSPAPVLIDEFGNQYDMVRVPKGSEIEQTTIYPGVIKRGNIYFREIKPGAKYLNLVMYLNEEKYVFGFKAEPIILKEVGLLNNTSIKITANATIGDIISQGGFDVGLRGYQNTPGSHSKVIIAVRNMESDEGIMESVEKPMRLDPAPVLIDDLGNQYDMVRIERGNRIRETDIYPGVVRTGDIFFKPINSGARYLWLIIYLNGEKYIFGFNAEPKLLEGSGVPVHAIKILPNASIGDVISYSGFEVRLKGFQNTQDWASRVTISIKNMEYENKLFRINAATVLLDDLGNQYEMININRAGRIEQTTIAPMAQKEGNIFFEPIKAEAKYVRLILRISSGRYEFGFKPGFNTS